jgi:hypothetical protein
MVLFKNHQKLLIYEKCFKSILQVIFEDFSF